MNKGIFITGTGTDVGKTYVTALLVKALRNKGINAGYYKAAISGAESISQSDAGYVNQVANIGQREETLLSYLYEEAVSPHLAAKLEGNPVEMGNVKRAFERVSETYEFVVMEGSGGIVCPIRYDEEASIFLEDIIKGLELETLIVADAGLGTINAVVLTVSYISMKGIGIRGILLNNYVGGVMQEDNIKMIGDLTGLPVISRIAPNAKELVLDDEVIERITDAKFAGSGKVWH